MPFFSSKTTPKQLPNEDEIDDCVYIIQNDKKPVSTILESSSKHSSPKQFKLSDVLEEVTQALATKVNEKENAEKRNTGLRLALDKDVEILAYGEKQKSILKAQLTFCYKIEEKEKQTKICHNVDATNSKEFMGMKFEELKASVIVLGNEFERHKQYNYGICAKIDELRKKSTTLMKSIEKDCIEITNALLEKVKEHDLIKKKHRDAMNEQAMQLKILKQKSTRIQQLILKGNTKQSNTSTSKSSLLIL
jgi:hypothetical protein